MTIGVEQFSVSPRPLGFWFGTKGLGAKVLGPGLDNVCNNINMNMDKYDK